MAHLLPVKRPRRAAERFTGLDGRQRIQTYYVPTLNFAAQGLGLGSIKSAEIRAAGRIVLAPVWEAGREGSSRSAAGGGRVGKAQLLPMKRSRRAGEAGRGWRSCCQVSDLEVRQSALRGSMGGREFKMLCAPTLKFLHTV